MCRRKPHKSLFDLVLFLFPWGERRESGHCLLSVLNMRDWTLRMIDLSLYSRDWKSSGSYNIKKERNRTIKRSLVTNWLKVFRWPKDLIIKNAVKCRGPFTGWFVNRVASLVLSGQSLAKLQFDCESFEIGVRAYLFGTFVWETQEGGNS